MAWGDNFTSLAKHSVDECPAMAQVIANNQVLELDSFPVLVSSFISAFTLSLIVELSREKLENDPMCGITTGGRTECNWDCNIVETSSNIFIDNPECYDDCFPQDHCISLLLQDYKNAGGQCEEDSAYPVSTSVTCELGTLDFDPTKPIEELICLLRGKNRTVGICSEKTEEALMTDGCYLDAFQKEFLFGSITSLIYDSCTQQVTDSWCGKEVGNINITTSKNQQELQDILENENRINPIAFVGQLNTGGTVQTKIEFENTKHRYPWICSLRSKHFEKTHFCAVTLLRRPPGPTVMVTAAHCTFLCKSEDGVILDNCCCENIRSSC